MRRERRLQPCANRDESVEITGWQCTQAVRPCPAQPYRPRPMLDFIGVDTLLAELVVALGLAVVIGNGLAFYKASRGERPEGVGEEAEFRPSRAMFLIAAGVLMTTWGIASIVGR